MSAAAVRWSAALLVLAAIGVASEARAFTLFDGDTLGLELRGYAQSAGGFQDPGYEVPVLGSLASGFHAQVLRLQWFAQLGDSLTLDVHNRFVTYTSSSVLGAGLGDAVGIGASVVPQRTVNLQTTFIDEGGFRASHDIDRLALRVFFGAGEVVLGRQAITWGHGSMFAVADVWTQFSPFELDQTEKPGIDAARVLYYPTPGLELDFIVADRGSLEDLSAGARASMVAGSADVYVAGGKFWQQIMAMAGVALDMVDFKLRAEIAQGYDADAARFRLPRGTIGADYFASDWSFSADYHFNGVGTPRAEDYVAQLSDPARARGESYYLNRHYVGLASSYGGIDRLRLSVAAITNVVDPSVIVTPSLSYEFSDNADITLGAFQGFGEKPVFDPGLQLRSEFGTYGGFYYAQFRGFF
ncbi:MAG: hypothetical protein H0U74_22225 [Bradymonadaceae bacterium]|nr:hypothetical protein [Lujinxingiaceae bacterium]